MTARSRPPADLQDMLRTHIDASARMKLLVEEADALQRAGKIREARKVLAKAEEIRAHLDAIEAEMKPQGPG